MPEQKKSIQERRMDSDARMLASAIRCFGQCGYTFSSIGEIAKGAGVTGGLITQRFATKENLFYEAYRTVMLSHFFDVKADATPRECLCSIIDQIVKLSETDRDAFEFCFMLHNSPDVPRGCLHGMEQQFAQGNIFRVMGKAQEKGVIPEGNLQVLVAAFCASVFHHVRLCRRFQMEIPGYGYYLKMIDFVDEATISQREWLRVLRTAFSNSSETLVHINIRDNSSEIMKFSDIPTPFANTRDARGSIHRVIDRDFAEADREKMKAFFNLDTLDARMGMKKFLTFICRDIHGNSLRHILMPVERDENGRLTEILVIVLMPNAG